MLDLYVTTQAYVHRLWYVYKSATMSRTQTRHRRDIQTVAITFRLRGTIKSCRDQFPDVVHIYGHSCELMYTQ